jgi:hypothetical protein
MEILAVAMGLLLGLLTWALYRLAAGLQEP